MSRMRLEIWKKQPTKENRHRKPLTVVRARSDVSQGAAETMAFTKLTLQGCCQPSIQQIGAVH